MVSFLLNYFEDISLLKAIEFYWNRIILYTKDFFQFINDTETVTYFEVIGDIFDDFQLKLFHILCGLIFFNLLLILIIWKRYGESICERFMINPTLREIEELRASVSKLKLPKEHSPRI